MPSLPCSPVCWRWPGSFCVWQAAPGAIRANLRVVEVGGWTYCRIRRWLSGWSPR